MEHLQSEEPFSSDPYFSIRITRKAYFNKFEKNIALNESIEIWEKWKWLFLHKTLFQIVRLFKISLVSYFYALKTVRPNSVSNAFNPTRFFSTLNFSHILLNGYLRKLFLMTLCHCAKFCMPELKTPHSNWQTKSN